MTKNNLLSEKLNYIGESETPTHLHVSSYNAEQIQTFRGHDIKDIQPLIKENCINWIQVHGLQNTETIHEICNYFNIDFLTIQDILNSEHPTKIEEMVEKAKEEVANVIKEEGERAVMETGVIGLHPDLVKLIGKLKYRTSYGQNVLNHSIEVSNLARIMAEELGLDAKLARRAGLLHDIGKALDHDMEGTHVELGVEVLKKYKENENVINAVQAHHGDVEPKTIEAVLVQAADAISASRPGARRETLEAYIKRLEQLEGIADSFEGVEKSFAIQAGREIRIIVKPDKIDDNQMKLMARDIAKRVEDEMEYPGQIKVNVVRETRVIDYAK